MAKKLLLVLGGLSLLIAGFAAPAQTRRAGAPESSTVVQAVDLPGLKKLLARDGKDPRPLLVNFWATWCDPCRDEFPDLVKIDEQYRPKGINFIAVSLDDLPDIKTTVPNFLRQMHATMPAYLLNVSDPEPAINAVDKEWRGSLPATFLYDAQGKVVFKHFGRVDAQELRAAIEKLVSSRQ
jgi:thiol-disulfide isomerase/thioredoxin